MLIILLIQQLHSCSVRRVPHRLNFSDPLVFHLLQKTICFGIVSVNYTLESVDEKTCLSYLGAFIVLVPALLHPFSVR